MKRLFFVATLAIMAAGCQKTFVQNEVQTPIGFSTEVGKQTRAIVSNQNYLPAQPFAVYAYGHQKNEDGSYVQVDGENNITTIMNNVEVKGTTNNAVTTWKATEGAYYWPNDPRTKINFYAYSPAKPTPPAVATASDKHQLLTGTVSHDEIGGFALTDYVHSNMYVDFMVGRPVLGATYADQDGTNGSDENLPSVPVSFNHEMTQIVFNVETSEAYSDVTFTVQSIVLNNIGSKATYTHTGMTPSYDDTDSKFTKGTWSATTATNTYNVFPASAIDADAADGAPTLQTDEVATVVTNTTVLATTPVTMIPQTLTASTPAVDQTPAVSGQSFTITYTIAGTGVATETVVKTLDFKKDAHTAWKQNTKVTYNITIGLKEITFAPTVVGWDSESVEHPIFQ